MEKHTASPSRFVPLTRRIFLAGLGASLLGTSFGTASAATKSRFQAWHAQTVNGLFPPAVIPCQDGRLELFTMGTDNNIYHRWQNSDLSWSDWYSHGAPPNTVTSEALFNVPPQLVMTSAGTLDLLTWDRGVTQLYLLRQTVPSGGWAGWQFLAGLPGPVGDDGHTQYVVAANDGTGNVQVFVSSRSNSSKDTFFQGTLQPTGAWSGWTELPPPSGNLIQSPTTAVNPDGRLELFGIGTGGVLWHTWQTSAGGTWANWYSHGTPGVPLTKLPFISYPTIAANADGRLDLFAIASNGTLYHLPQAILNANWGSWASLGAPSGTILHPLSMLGIGSSADKRLEVFAMSEDGNLWHIWQTDLSGGWSNWYSHGHPTNASVGGALTIHLNRDGFQELFILASDENMYSIKQVVQNGGWSDWISFGRP